MIERKPPSLGAPSGEQTHILTSDSPEKLKVSTRFLCFIRFASSISRHPSAFVTFGLPWRLVIPRLSSGSRRLGISVRSASGGGLRVWGAQRVSLVGEQTGSKWQHPNMMGFLPSDKPKKGTHPKFQLDASAPDAVHPSCFIRLLRSMSISEARLGPDSADPAFKSAANTLRNRIRQHGPRWLARFLKG